MKLIKLLISNFISRVLLGCLILIIGIAMWMLNIEAGMYITIVGGGIIVIHALALVAMGIYDGVRSLVNWCLRLLKKK